MKLLIWDLKTLNKHMFWGSWIKKIRVFFPMVTWKSMASFISELPVLLSDYFLLFSAAFVNPVMGWVQKKIRLLNSYTYRYVFLYVQIFLDIFGGATFWYTVNENTLRGKPRALKKHNRLSSQEWRTFTWPLSACNSRWCSLYSWWTSAQSVCQVRLTVTVSAFWIFCGK